MMSPFVTHADESVAVGTPTLATRRMMRKIAHNEWPLARFVDRRRGVVFVDYHAGHREEVSARRACDTYLTSRLAGLSRRLAAQPEDTIWCENQPRIECTLGSDHDTQSVSLRFVRAASGLVLDAVLTLTEGGMPQEEERVIPLAERKLAALRGGECPAAR
jgi:hypothetical protein